MQADVEALTGCWRVAAHYSASKSGLEGLSRELAVDVGRYGAAWDLFTPGHEGASLHERRERMLEVNAGLNMLGVPWLEPEDLANAVLYLASDVSKMVTGIALPVDAGFAAH